ncbi:MAG: hypothetical protein Salg2KO_02090 [Salibacteraceae bacterium]
MFLRHNVLGLCWAVFIFILSALPGSQFENQTYPSVDKVIHIILYGVLFLLLTTGFIKQRLYPWLREHTKLKVFIGVMLYGILLEILQGLFFDGRNIEIVDMLANAFGAATGWLLFLAIYGNKKYS